MMQLFYRASGKDIPIFALPRNWLRRGLGGFLRDNHHWRPCSTAQNSELTALIAFIICSWWQASLDCDLRPLFPDRRIAQMESAPTTPGRSQVRVLLRLPSYENRRPKNSGQDFSASLIRGGTHRLRTAVRYRATIPQP